MTICDWILTAIIVFAVWSGWRQGIINVIGHVASVFIAYIVARSWSDDIVAYFSSPDMSAGLESNQQLVAFLSLFINTDTLANRLLTMLAFIVLFVVTRWLIKKLSYMISSFFSHGLLRSLNRTFGAVLSFLLVLVLILILSDVVLPALVNMGFGSEPLNFIYSSKVVLPVVKYIQYLF